MCGEHRRQTQQGSDLWGSSPHVRGTPPARQTPEHRTGIIPACAGNTCGGGTRRSRKRDHPRMCGEHSVSWFTACAVSGSSPHVRGTLWASFRRRANTGIIPACAGNTVAHPCAIVSVRDHPRMCGEHFMAVNNGSALAGSSPHVRGTPTTVIPCSAIPGIIPACAGNTGRCM